MVSPYVVMCPAVQGYVPAAGCQPMWLAGHQLLRVLLVPGVPHTSCGCCCTRPGSSRQVHPLHLQAGLAAKAGCAPTNESGSEFARTCAGLCACVCW